MDLIVLRAELLDDPLGVGYAAMTDAQAANAINTLTRTLERESIPTQEVIEAVVTTDYASLTAGQREIFWGLVSAGSINPKGNRTRAILGSLFGVGTQTRANLLALADVQITRASELGLGKVYPGHVAKARALEL